MSSNLKDDDSKSSSDVSKFKVDGVVAEMVIDVDEENEPHDISFTENRLVKSKELLPEKPKLTSEGNNIDNKNKLQTDDELNSENEMGSKENDQSSEKDDSSSIEKESALKDDSSSSSNDKPNTNVESSEEEIETSSSDEDESILKDDESSSDEDVESEEEVLKKLELKKQLDTKGGRKVKRKLEEPENNAQTTVKRPVGRPKSIVSGANNKGSASKTLAVKPKTAEIKAKSAVQKSVGKSTPTAQVPIRRSLAGRPIKRKNLDEDEELAHSSPKRSVGRPKKVITQEDDSKKNNQNKMSSKPNAAKDVSSKKTYESTGCSLGSIPGLCSRIETAKRTELRLLYKTIYNQWPSFTNMDKIISELNEFSGFTFQKNSKEYDRRQKLLLSFVDSHISVLAKILGVKVGPKIGMIANILNFLLKPNFKVCLTDKSLQPVVRLERISLDNEYLSQKVSLVTRKASSQKTPTAFSPRKTRQGSATRAAHMKLKLRSKTKKRSTSPKGPIAKKVNLEDVEIKNEVLSDTEDSMSIRESSAVLQSSLSSKFSDNVENDSEITVVKTESVDEERKACCFYHGAEEISEDTLSSEEALLEKRKSKSPTKKQMMQKIKKPLVMFPNIKESINQADLQPLQRLHILLFGASEKPEQLRHNILAFGGFPFREGSEEWKQKEFLLSLLAPNTLKEYLKILCIEYAEDDQLPVLISKLMLFLSAPGGVTVVPDDPYPKVMPKLMPRIIATQMVKKDIKKKPKKVIEKKSKFPRHRKVLMDEAQVRRLEADIAREQRIMAREKKSEDMRREVLGRILGKDNTCSSFHSNSFSIRPSVTGMVSQPIGTINHDVILTNNVVSHNTLLKQVPSSDANAAQVNALLQTVYKRRALKEAGVLISVPNTGKPTKLGELDNVKFMVVTANYNDLDILHHLIFMSDGTKTKVRKNILEFSGFGFDEDSEKYKKRMDFLNGLGHDISKRIAFLLGLSSFHTQIGQQDLNELILYFLMAPSKIKHAPIKDMPQDFFRDVTKDVNLLIFKPIAPAPDKNAQAKQESSQLSKTPQAILPAGSPAHLKISTPNQTAILPNTQPIVTADGLKLFPVQKVVLPPKSLLNNPGSVATGSDPPPLQSLPQFILQHPSGSTTSGGPSPMQPNTQIILEPMSSQTGSNNAPAILPEQLIVQQRPEGGGPPKMFKLVKLAPDHPLSSVIGNKTLQVNTQSNTSNLQMKFGPPVIRVPTPAPAAGSASPGNILPPGIIIFKKDLQGSQAVIQNAPSVQPAAPEPVSADDDEQYDEPQGEVPSDYWSNDEEVEVLHPLANNPPTDNELFESIQEIIHNSNFEDITLRNVIDKVSAQYSEIDLSHKQNFMKDCVKRIIIGT